MVTTFDKAIASFLSALVMLIGVFWPPVHTYVSAETLAMVSPVVIALATWLVPNKAKA